MTIDAHSSNRPLYDASVTSDVVADDNSSLTVQLPALDSTVDSIYRAFERMPLELVMIIFTLVQVTDHHAPIILSAVCRYWRNFVRDTPTLWYILVLGPHAPHRKALLYLMHSKNNIRRLTIHGLRASKAFCKLRDQERFCTVTSLEVHLVSDKHYFKRASLLWWTQFNLPHLTSIQCFAPDPNTTVVWFESEALTQVQRLEHCIISASTFHFSEWLNTTRLKTLVFEVAHTSRERLSRHCASCCIHRILRWSPLLESVSLKGTTVETCSPTWVDAPFTIECLKSLRLAGCFTCASVLNLLRLPALQSLHIAVPADVTVSSVLARLVDAGIASVTELRITRIPDIDCSILAPYILEMNKLCTLELAHCKAQINDLIYRLALRQPPFPLEDISISDCPALTCDALETLIYARIGTGDHTTPLPMHTISVQGCTNITSLKLHDAMTDKGRTRRFAMRELMSITHPLTDTIIDFPEPLFSTI
ncbi:hypothetical protein EXIGLDRAFT_758834 [Exidia glandulosa HHB12029]|uniref:Uncharacterized protein n=1 Tax=Exidia glandulosa HHB12029 TaxID=1314781 RepID=A0A165QEA3_EXIGL|nr:hypothetical protein EXIGLDRAFT_758834 [Exidia glandulosa HHB12029]